MNSKFMFGLAISYDAVQISFLVHLINTPAAAASATATTTTTTTILPSRRATRTMDQDQLIKNQDPCIFVATS